MESIRRCLGCCMTALITAGRSTGDGGKRHLSVQQERCETMKSGSSTQFGVPYYVLVQCRDQMCKTDYTEMAPEDN